MDLSNLPVSIPLVLTLTLGACSSDGDSPEAETTGTLTSTGGGSTGTPTGSVGDTTAGEDTVAGSESEGTAAGCVPAGGELVREELMLDAADGTQLAATVVRPAEGSCLPGVLLVHQYTNQRGQWDDIVPRLVDAGYVALAIDLRGHGDSDPQQGALDELLTDPDQAPQDVAAGVQWLAGSDAIDPDRIAVWGTSIGANLSVVALHQGGVAAAVPVSPRLSSVLSLAGMPASLSLTNIFCLATDGDGGGAQADTCMQLVADATGEARLEIIEGSSAHGVALLDGFPELVPEVIAWLDATI